MSFKIGSLAVIIDTNVFLHLRDVGDLPWCELFPNAKNISLVVTPIVISELDEFKTGSRKRLRDRSRKALKAIRDTALNGDEGLILRNTPISVKLTLSERRNFDWSAHPNLDQSKADDTLVMEALTFHPKAALVTCDTGPFLTAIGHDVQAYIPPDEWHLPAEATANEMKIRRLEAELKASRANAPIIKLTIGDQDSDEPIRFIIPRLPPLDNSLARRLSDAYLELHPRHNLGPSNSSPFYVASVFNDYSETTRENYGREYAKFRSKVRTLFEYLHENVAEACTVQPVNYEIANVSEVSADGLRVEISTATPFLIMAGEEEADKITSRVSLPLPPRKPQRGMMGLHGDIPALRNVALHSVDRSRDPTKFYWQDRPGDWGDSESAIQCKDFRAKETREKTLWLRLEGETDSEGIVAFKVSATNMREPLVVTRRVSFVEIDTSWEDPRFHHRLPVPLDELLPDLI